MIEPKKASKDYDIILDLERHKDSQQVNTRGKCVGERDGISDNLNYCTEERTIGNTDVNQFYTQECISDTKVIEKLSVPSYDTEQVPAAIYNDISQKLIPKQQNGSSSPKIDNRYDKKWNQFNLKPSVSNVFNSLNEYINAPPGSSDCIHSVLDEPEIESDLETKAIYHGSEVPQLIQSTVKDSDKSITHKQVTDVTDSSREASVLCRPDVTVPMPLELPIICETSINEDIVKGVHLASVEKSETEPEISEDITETRVVCTESTNKVEDSNKTQEDSCSFDANTNEENNTTLDCTYSQSQYNVQESAIESSEGEVKLCMENTETADEQKASLNPAPKPVGFGNINDLSEDELTKYLAELEEEEQLNEICDKHEDISHTVESVSEDEKNENKQNAQSFMDTVAGPSKMGEAELNAEVENISIKDCRKEEVDKEILKNALEEEAEQQHDDHTIENKHSDILNNLSSTDAKLLHTANEHTDHTVKLEVVCVTAENQCVPDAKSSKDSQDDSTYSLNINQETLDECKTEIQLKEQAGNSAQHSQAGELKMHSDTDSNTSEDRNSMTPKIKIFDDKTRHTDDVKLTSVEVSKPNMSDISDDTEKPLRPQTLDIVLTNNSDEHQTLGSTSDTPSGQVQSDVEGTKEEQGSSPDILENSLPESSSVLGKEPPFWVPDGDAPSCMLCDVKFTVLKRRHHCRACGKVLCNKCCNMKYKLEYQGNIDSRVCVSCYQLLTKGNTLKSV